MSGVWTWLKDEANRKVLGWVVAGLGCIAIYFGFFKPEEKKVSAPASHQWQTDVVVSAWKLSGLVPNGLTRQESAVQLREALSILHQLKAAGALRVDQQGWSQMIQQRLDGWK